MVIFLHDDKLLTMYGQTCCHPLPKLHVKVTVVYTLCMAAVYRGRDYNYKFCYRVRSRNQISLILCMLFRQQICITARKLRFSLSSVLVLFKRISFCCRHAALMSHRFVASCIWHFHMFGKRKL